MEPEVTQPPPAADAGNVVPTNGVQSRIDELTGTIHEQRRQLEQMGQTMQEVIAQSAAVAAKQSMTANAPVAQALPEGIDPTLVDYLSKSMTQAISEQMTRMEQKFTQAFGSVRQSQEAMEFQAAAQGVEPKVIQEAQKLMTDWKRRGLSGWKPEDAILHAEAIMARQARQAQNRNRPNGVGEEGAGGQPPPTNRQLPPAKSDAELAGMPLDAQLEYLGKRVGDSELIY